MHQTFETGKKGERKKLQKAVDREAYSALGFPPGTTIITAKAQCKILNRQNSIEKEKIRLTAKRYAEIRSLDTDLFPQKYLEDFKDLLDEENFGSEAHLTKLISHFSFIQKMCTDLKISPNDYKAASKKIYKYFISKQISLSYSVRLINLLNRWGAFFNRQIDRYYEPVKQPQGQQVSKIVDEQVLATGRRRASNRLTVELLKARRSTFTPEQFNWLLISIWFGLRPSEINNLLDPDKTKIVTATKNQPAVLEIYQPKLTRLPDEQRWKYIPCFLTNQIELLDAIANGDLKQPTYKQMRQAFKKEKISLYGGRKGFTDLMLDLDQKPEEISAWMGHRSIETTWQHYKDRTKVRFSPVLPKSHLKAVK